jgi:thioester reductase-like protein
MGDVTLITGFPRLAARKLAVHILSSEPEERVVLVVLPKLIASAAALVEGMPRGQRQRVEILEGDAAAMDMGLSGAEYRELAGSVTRIHHLAHVSYVGIDRETAEHVNITGAVEAVELARAAHELRVLVHHSTAHVCGDRTGTVYEDDLDEGQGFHSVVQQTRMKAELVMRRAMRDVPIAVVRPTVTVGDSTTGEVERLDGPYLLVMLVLGLPGEVNVPLPSPGDNPLDIVPVDFVVRAAYAIGRDPRAIGRTHHLASPEGLTARQVFDLIADAGGRRVTTRSVIPTQVATAILSTPGVDRLVREPRAFLQQLTSKARFDTRNARAILDGTDIRCPPLEEYVGTWVTAVKDYWQARG